MGSQDVLCNQFEIYTCFTSCHETLQPLKLKLVQDVNCHYKQIALGFFLNSKAIFVDVPDYHDNICNFGRGYW